MLPVTEISTTLVGEGLHIGEPCTLIRLSGCNLKCEWCDTPLRDEAGEPYEIDRLVSVAGSAGKPWVLVTGGEPLMRRDTPELLRKLLKRGLKPILETNGTFPLSDVPDGVVKSVDIKTPSSGFAGCFRDSNVVFMNSGDCVKFVVADREDFEWSIKEIRRLNLLARTGVFFSPVHGRMDPGKLARMVLECGLPVALTLQIHKFLDLP